MANIKRISMPLTSETVSNLKAGDLVVITGSIYTAREPVHKLLVDALRDGKNFPVDLKGQIIYYGAPCPAKPGFALGSCGPSSSFRIDPYTPPLLELGLKGVVGKGPRSPEVIKSLVANKALYFAAVGGAAALVARIVRKAEIVAYEELGPEALRRLEVEEFPCIVATDAEGKDLYVSGVDTYRKV